MTRTTLALWLLLPLGAHAQTGERFLCYLPELRRDEIARELTIEWAQRGWELTIATDAPPESDVALDAARAGAMSAVVVVALPHGVMRGAELSVAHVAEGRWRFATIPVPYDVTDSRALAIAAAALASAHDAPEPPPQPAPPEPQPDPERAPEIDPAPSAGPEALALARAPRVHIGIDLAVGPAWDWLDATQATPLVNAGVALGADLQLHDASGHGISFDYRYYAGLSSERGLGFSHFIDVRYGYRVHERLWDWVGAAFTLEAGAAFTWARYHHSLLSGPIVDRMGLGPVVGATGHVLLGPIGIGAELVYHATANPWGSNSPTSGGAVDPRTLGAGWVTFEHAVTFGLRLGVHLDI